MRNLNWLYPVAALTSISAVGLLVLDNLTVSPFTYHLSVIDCKSVPDAVAVAVAVAKIKSGGTALPVLLPAANLSKPPALSVPLACSMRWHFTYRQHLLNCYRANYLYVIFPG